MFNSRNEVSAWAVDFPDQIAIEPVMANRRLVPLILVALTALGVFYGSYAYFKSQELDKAAQRLTLYESSLEAELRRFAHMPFLLSLDPVVAGTLNGGDRRALDLRLARFAESAGLDAIYLMDRGGMTISASNAGTGSSFVGQNYGFRPYFAAALAGDLGEFYGIGATTGIPGYFYAMAVRADGAPRGVVAIKLDLSALQESWQASGERIVLSNADGVVLLASEPGWRYRTLDPLSAQQRARIRQARQFGDEPLAALNWARDAAGQTAEIDGDRFLYLRADGLPNDWSLHFFAPDDQAVIRALLASSAVVLLSGLMFIVWQRRRVHQIGAALKVSEREEAELRLANERLAVEIEERRTVERSLRKTKEELERAGRLAALGQLASSVTHELGQPIAAMRNQLAASELSVGPSPLNEKMQALVSRMEDITRQLKFFSRKGRDKFELVDLADVVEAALDLNEPGIEMAGAKVVFDRADVPVMVHGNRLRLEQVVTNLVRNALDAVEGGAVREIVVQLGQDARTVWFEVADTGHGLGGRSMEDLREPFATTRESGKGMGLGLTISAGIVTDHGGTLSAKEGASGGAVFRAELPKPQEDMA